MHFNIEYISCCFFPNKFFSEIFNAKFDVTKAGNSITIPLKYNYDTVYGVFISVPDEAALWQIKQQQGICEYEIVSEGKILAKGKTFPPGTKRSIMNKGESSSLILELNLPYPGEKDDLYLNLKVVEPMLFLSKYKGKIACFVRPKDIYT